MEWVGLACGGQRPEKGQYSQQSRLHATNSRFSHTGRLGESFSVAERIGAQGAIAKFGGAGAKILRGRKFCGLKAIVRRAGGLRILLASLLLFSAPTVLSQTPRLQDELCWMTFPSGYHRLHQSSFSPDPNRLTRSPVKKQFCSSSKNVPDISRFLSLRPAAVGANPKAFQDGPERNMSGNAVSANMGLKLPTDSGNFMAPFSEDLSSEDTYLVYTWDGDLMPRFDAFSTNVEEVSYGDGEFPVYTYDGEEHPFVLKGTWDMDRYDRWDTYDTDFFDPSSQECADKANFAVPSNYNWNATTCQNYASPEGPGKFFGKFKDVRADLDYTYHVNYVEERQYLQDEIISYWTQSGVTADEPWIIFTAGAMGSGKSQTVKSLGLQGLHSLYDMVTVDPDAVKYQLPEMQHYIRRNPGPEPESDIILAGEATHNESAYLQEIIVRELLDSSKHLIVDGSLSNAEWYSEYFLEIRRRYPHYKIGILHVVCDVEVIWERVQERCLRTGRCISREVVDESVAMTPKAVSRLAPLTDFIAVIDSATDPVRFIRAMVSKGKVRTKAEKVEIWTPYNFGLDGPDGIPVECLERLLSS